MSLRVFPGISPEKRMPQESIGKPCPSVHVRRRNVCLRRGDTMAGEIEGGSEWVKRAIGWTIESSYEAVYREVDQIRSKHPELTADELVRGIVRKASLKNGLLGAVTSIGGMVTLPISIPADLLCSWRILVS